MIYVTFYPHVYGFGATADESKARARAHGGRGRRYATVRLPEGAIDPMVDPVFGALSWTWAADSTEEQRAATATVVTERR